MRRRSTSWSCSLCSSRSPTTRLSGRSVSSRSRSPLPRHKSPAATAMLPLRARPKYRHHGTTPTPSHTPLLIILIGPLFIRIQLLSFFLSCYPLSTTTARLHAIHYLTSSAHTTKLIFMLFLANTTLLEIYFQVSSNFNSDSSLSFMM